MRNQQYNVASFFPIVLYEQFKFFFNLYFLLVALSQFVPQLRIGMTHSPAVRVEYADSGEYRLLSNIYSPTCFRARDNDRQRSL